MLTSTMQLVLKKDNVLQMELREKELASAIQDIRVRRRDLEEQRMRLEQVMFCFPLVDLQPLSHEAVHDTVLLYSEQTAPDNPP